MKNFTLILFLGVFFAFRANAQDCQKFREGSFVNEDDQSGTTYITRKGDVQTEVNNDIGFSIELKITWISDCEYELKLVKVLENKLDIPHDPNLVIKVVILETKENSFVQETTSDAFDFTYKSEIFRSE